MIPEEAVEAALRAWAIRGGLSPEGIVRSILESAAPHMLADAWDACADLPSRPDKVDNPYRSQA